MGDSQLSHLGPVASTVSPTARRTYTMPTTATALPTAPRAVRVTCAATAATAAKAIPTPAHAAPNANEPAAARPADIIASAARIPRTTLTPAATSNAAV